jgi:hypothetical protein
MQKVSYKTSFQKYSQYISIFKKHKLIKREIMIADWMKFGYNVIRKMKGRFGG